MHGSLAKLFFLLCLALPLGAPLTAAAQRPGELTIINRSQHVINELYVSPSTADSWGNDLLGEAAVQPGASFRLRPIGAHDCLYDVQVVYEDGSREEHKHVDICRTRALVVDGSAAIPPEAGPPHAATLVNDSARPIQQVFISPADSTQWGDDRLGNHTLSVGERVTVVWHGACVVDLRVVFDNRGAEERRGMDLCATQVLAIRPGWTTSDVVPTEP